MQLNVSQVTDKEGDRIRRIKQEAENQILTLCPDWKQRNMLAETSALIRRVQEGTNTPEDDIRQVELDAFWDDIQSLRDTSDAAEASGIQPDKIVW